MLTTKNAALVPEFVLQRMIVRGTSSSQQKLQVSPAKILPATAKWQIFLMTTLRYIIKVFLQMKP